MADLRPWVVLKFGGTSVSSRARWETIAAQCRERLDEGLRPLVVCSAVSGVSDGLEALLRGAVAGDPTAALAALQTQHQTLADALGIDLSVASAEIDALERIATGIALIGEVSPRVHARVLSAGELVSTRLGAGFLQSQGLSAGWMDARKVMKAVPEPHATERRRYLSAIVSDDADPVLAADLAARPEAVLVTQGFIATDRAGATVLLGRGGSDTSAAVFAAKLGATRCEIWTDVPGLFTANPRQVPEARLLQALDYDEAQEIASTGAKVLHPRCLPPVRRAGIPVHVRCTPRPELPSTVITAEGARGGSRVKAISARKGLTLVSMSTVGMWQQVGFLADVFAVFKAHGLSVDLVSTSEANVTVSLDPAANALEAEVLDELVADLAPLCRAKAIRGCASVSLVGRDIRAILHRLGPALAVFEEQRVHLVSQAASDLNLTVVVDDNQADRLVLALHAQLFGDEPAGTLLGHSWRELFEGVSEEVVVSVPWWETRRGELLALAADRTPLYVLDAASLDAAAAELQGLQSIDRVLYAIKANPHPEALTRFAAAGLGFECVSPGELDRVMAAVPGLDPADILFTPNFAPRAEYSDALERGVRVTLDNLHPLRAWPDLFAGREVFLRIDPGRGRGHHPHVRTAGAQSKFGIAPSQLDEARELSRHHGVKIVGLHAHAGSGVVVPEAWAETATFLADVALAFPDVTVLDLGGGLGIPDKPGKQALDLHALDSLLGQFRRAHPRFSLWIEPGRYLVARAGVLLAAVTQLKSKGDVHYVGVDAGMNVLIRPALYGAHHEIVNLTRLDAPRTETAHVVGPICETGDTLGYARRLPPTAEGDVLLLATTGAYGRAMSSSYNLRQPADEVVLAPLP